MIQYDPIDTYMKFKISCIRFLFFARLEIRKDTLEEEKEKKLVYAVNKENTV